MGIQCDCSCDCDEMPRCQTTTTRRARREHQCCECYDTIVRGERYCELKGLDYDGDPFIHRTCLPCERIRQQYCPSGYYIGGLAEQIEPCIGFDYREAPDQGEPDNPEFDGGVSVGKTHDGETRVGQ